MQLTHSFTVPISVGQAWEVLRDIERVGPCMPGATIDSVNGDEFTGRVKVKVGPMQVTYKGKAAFTEVDEDRHRAVIDAKGQESPGSGTARAQIAAELTERDGQTEVTVVTDLTITGRPAQFGRGVMADVGQKLLDQFADCLAGQLGEQQTEAIARPGVDEPSREIATNGASPARDEEEQVLDLLAVSRAPVLKRLVPVVAALLAVLGLGLLRRRGRR